MISTCLVRCPACSVSPRATRKNPPSEGLSLHCAARGAADEVLLEEDHEQDDRHGVEHRAGEYPVPVHAEQSLERREAERQREVLGRAHYDERPLERVPRT